MNTKRFATKVLALTSAAAITLSILPAVHGANSATAAAKTTVELTGMSRTAAEAAPLTREGMCGMAMDAYRSLTGPAPRSLEKTDSLFLDTDSADVADAYKLGLVTEQRDGFFGPEEDVSRQDFFTSTVQLLEEAGYPYVDDISVDLSDYSDSDDLLAYAVQPTQVLLSIGALEKSDCLQPDRPITDEEAAVIMDRVVSFFSEWQEDPVEPQRYLGEEVAQLALTKVGCRYVSGGHGPSKFDCSGLVYWTYKQFGYDLKPGARNQWSILGSTVKKADLLPGDLLFFSNNGKASGIFHVGIYIGGGEFVHAANSRKGVIVTDIDESWYANRYIGAKRAIQ